MEKQFVDVIYDRRKLAAKRGKGYVEVRVYLGRNERKYFPMGMASPDEWETLAASEEVTQLLRKCKKIVTAMDVLDEEMTMDNFNLHFYGEEVMQKKEEENRERMASAKPFHIDTVKQFNAGQGLFKETDHSTALPDKSDGMK